jgi:hypothetical protein
VSDPVEYHDLDDLVVLATRLFGRPPPIRDAGLLGRSTAADDAAGRGRIPMSRVSAHRDDPVGHDDAGHELEHADRAAGWRGGAARLSPG